MNGAFRLRLRRPAQGRPCRQSAAALAVCLIFAGCRTTREPDAVEQERLQVVAWTLPPGGAVLSSGELRRSGQGAVAVWELSVPVDWAQYRRWVGQGGRRGYRPIGGGDRSLSFSRLDRGDQFLVDLVAVTAGPPVMIRVTFTGRPE